MDRERLTREEEDRRRRGALLAGFPLWCCALGALMLLLFAGVYTMAGIALGRQDTLSNRIDRVQAEVNNVGQGLPVTTLTDEEELSFGNHSFATTLVLKVADWEVDWSALRALPTRLIWSGEIRLQGAGTSNGTLQVTAAADAATGTDGIVLASIWLTPTAQSPGVRPDFDDDQWIFVTNTTFAPLHSPTRITVVGWTAEGDTDWFVRGQQLQFYVD